MPSRRVKIRDTSLSELRPRRPFGFPAYGLAVIGCRQSFSAPRAPSLDFAHSRQHSTPDVGIIEWLAAQPLGHRLQIDVP
jgi:hypothetical protein